MGWVNEAIKELSAGREVRVRPQGGSMRGRIESGQLVVIVPVKAENLKVDDVVLVAWKGNYLLHLIKDIKEGQFLIGNNVGKINGWVDGNAIRGKVTEILENQ